MGKQSKQKQKPNNTNNQDASTATANEPGGGPPFAISPSEYENLEEQVSSLTLEELQEEWILAARYGDLDVLHAILASQQYRQLTDKKVLINAQDAANGNTALHMAAANGHVDICRLLLLQQNQQQEATGLLVNHSGNTPLHWAAANGHDAVVELLLKHVDDCDVLQKNDFGRSALTEGFTSQNTNVVKHMLEHDSATEEKLLQGGTPLNSNNEQSEEERTNESTTTTTTTNALLPLKNELVHEFDFDLTTTNQQRHLRVRELPIPGNQDCFGDRPELDTTGYGIWAASLIMARWMAAFHLRFQNKTILELGAGCGVPGLAAAFYSNATKVYLTDLNPATVQNLQYNIQLNHEHGTNWQDRLSAGSINWDDPATWPPEKVDFVIGSDLIYQESIVPILKKVILGLCQGQGTFLYVAPDTESDIGRDGLAEFIQAMTETPGCRLVSDHLAPKEYHANPLSSQDDDICFLHFHELTSANYRLYEFQINTVAATAADNDDGQQQ